MFSKFQSRSFFILTVILFAFSHARDFAMREGMLFKIIPTQDLADYLEEEGTFVHDSHAQQEVKKESQEAGYFAPWWEEAIREQQDESFN